jgi:hypothetical protein
MSDEDVFPSQILGISRKTKFRGPDGVQIPVVKKWRII